MNEESNEFAALFRNPGLFFRKNKFRKRIFKIHCQTCSPAVFVYNNFTNTTFFSTVNCRGVNLLMIGNKMVSANSVVIKFTVFVALLFCL
jgi:hypothetical protein